MNSFNQIAGMLAQRAQEIVQFLLPQGKRMGAEWCVGGVSGEVGDSLKVHLTGEKSGVWCDFATGEKGDLLELWRLNRNIDIKAALKEAEQYLGVGKPKFDGYKKKTFIRQSPDKVKSIISTSPVMNYLMNERKLTAETIHAFKIGEQNREIIFPYLHSSDSARISYGTI